MSMRRGRWGDDHADSSAGFVDAPAAGKGTVTQDLPARRHLASPAAEDRPPAAPAAPVDDPFGLHLVQCQATAAPAASPAAVHEAAALGTSGAAGALPFASQIQRAFGRHDIGGIQAHTDASARDGAAAMGAEAFATGDHVAFGVTPSLHTAAHEAAHVVQQRGGVQLKGGVGEARDAHERHADAVADAVVTGRSAEPLLDQYQGRGPASAPTPAVQRFGADEHRNMGNEGSGARDVELADDYSISFGEVTALAADHFESIQQLRAFAKKKTGKESREEIDYAREWKLGAKGMKYSEEAKREQIRRYYALASNNAVHFVNPNAGDQGRTTAEKAGALDADKKSTWWPKGTPKNAIAGFRHNHVMAINEALNAGKAGGPISSAMANEAFASHYLTDAFSSGHIRTDRNEIPAYWNSKVPMFFLNFVGYLAEKIAGALGGGYNLLTKDAKVSGLAGFDGAQQIVDGKIRAKGVIGFGDIVATALHDYDNEVGVSARSEGKKVELKGDGHAGEGDEKGLAVRAVSLGVNDCERAHALGKGGSENADELLGADHMFAPERLIPTLDSAPDPKNPAVNWRADSAYDLLTIRQFRKALFIFCQEKKSDLLEVGKDLGGAKEAALKKAIVSKLETEDGCVGLIWGVLNWTPNTGGGLFGHNQDDNAADYYDAAANIPGGVQTLTWTARANLIIDLMAGWKTWKDEEQRIWYLLDFAPEADARKVIKFVGWGTIADALEDGEDTKFKKKFPKAEYGQ